MRKKSKVLNGVGGREKRLNCDRAGGTQQTC